MRFYWRLILFTISMVWLLPAQPLFAADGTLPNQLVLEGNYCVAHGGVGLFYGSVQSFQITVEGTPVHAYAYWSGRYEDGQPGDDRIRMTFNDDGGRPVRAAESNEAYAGFRREGVDVFYYTYRSDNIVAELPASSTLDVRVNNLLTPEAHGVGLVVISEGPNCAYSRVQLNFGLDGFYWNFPPPPGPDTEVTCVDFPAATADRAMDLQMFVGGVEYGEARADRIWYATGSGTKPTDIVSIGDPANVLAGPVPPAVVPPPAYPLTGSNGHWDDYANSITIPAGATYACFQIESIDRIDRSYPNGTSGVWVELMTRLIYEPGVALTKLTNGNDAKHPNDPDVPVIEAGAEVIWTYLLTNTGQVTFTAADIALNDLVEGQVTERVADRVGDDDDRFAPGETWRYQRTGTALDLANTTDSFVVVGCGNATTGGFLRNTYANRATAQVGDLVVDDTSHYCNPAVPGIALLKLTNGNDAKQPNAPDVPMIAPGANVTWTYLVTNTGQVTFDAGVVVVSDSVEGMVQTRIADRVGDNDNQLEPGETWTYQATGVALTLNTATGTFVVSGCGDAATGGTVRNTYTNSATVVANALSASDTSHYCNPLVPGLAVLKLTNGHDAKSPNDADVPLVVPGAPVTWTYLVTNTGEIAFTADLLRVTDSVEGEITNRLTDSVGDNDNVLEPGETWRYAATGTALTLAEAAGTFIVNGCGNSATGGIIRNTYANRVTAQVDVTPPLVATDTSHYCNPLDTATVGNYVWGDINPGGGNPEAIANGNGIQENDPREQGIDGIYVELYTSAGELVAATVTSNGGSYLFTNIEPGEYYLVFINPLGTGIWTFSNAVPDDEIDSDAEQETPDNRGVAQRTALFRLEPGDIDLRWDAGLIGLSGAGSATVGNFIWNDRNRDGIQDGGTEIGIANVTVRLYREDGTLVQTVTTDNLGVYNFAAIDPGTYYIEVDLPENFQVSPQDTGTDDEIDSDFDPTLGRTALFTVPAFITDLRWDLGIHEPTNLGETAEPQRNRLFLPLVLR